MRQAFLAPALLLLLASPAAADVDPEIAEARAIVKSFAGKLQGELQAAMKAGGPPAAIEVCQQAAPAIAAEASAESGWKVGRTALKVRNPDNAPNDVEAGVLEGFAGRHAAGESFEMMEYTGPITTAEGDFLHYMKAIPLGEVCATCHGSDIDPGLQALIDERYPRDQATGFEVGELRGAFTLYKPLD